MFSRFFLYPVTGTNTGSTVVVSRNLSLPTTAHCYGGITGTDFLFWVWARKEEGFVSRRHQSIFQWGKASEVHSSGVSSCNIVPVTVLQYRSKTGGVAVIRVSSVGLTITGIAWE